MTDIKPLKWKPYRNGDAEAVGLFGVIYTAYASGHWRITNGGKAGKFIAAGRDVEAAKAGAQADFENHIRPYILPALTTSPASSDVDSAPVLFGLEAQGHIPTIKAMLAEGADWQEIGLAILWDGETAKSYYERYLARRAPASSGVEGEAVDAVLQPLEDIHVDSRGLCKWADVATAIGIVRRAMHQPIATGPQTEGK